MSLLALLVALLARNTWPGSVGPQPLQALYGRLCVSTAKRLDAGDRNSGVVAWFALMLVVLVPLALATIAAAALHAIVLWVLNVGVLYASLRFLATVRRLGAIESALREGRPDAAANALAQWQGESVEVDDAGSIARLASEHALREAHHGAFAMLFWFLVLPGPIGVVLHPLAQRAARTWEQSADPAERDFGWFATRAFFVIDWIPQRVSAFVFAIVGDFEDAMLCWRSQAAQWLRPEEGIVLASGAGALGVRLGEPIARAGAFIDRPVLGTGEPAREDALASLQGLLWRSLVVWLVAYLLAAALQLA